MKFKILNLTKKFLEYNSRKEKKVQTDFPPRKPRDIRNNKFRIKSNNDIIISSAINKNNNNLSKQSSDININNKLIDSKKKDDVKTVIFGSTKELNRISNLNNNINNNSNSNSNSNSTCSSGRTLPFDRSSFMKVLTKLIVFCLFI